MSRGCDLTATSGNEREVGQGIKDSGVPREEIFLTSKLWNTHQPNVREGLQQTLNDLGTDYLDLYVSRKQFCVIAGRLIPCPAHPLAGSTCPRKLVSSSI